MTLMYAVLAASPGVIAFLDAQRFSDRVWRRSGQLLLTWTLIIFLLPGIGPLAYLVTARPRLVRARTGPPRAGPASIDPPPG